MIHTVWWGQWSRCFLEFPCFLYVPADVSNLISGSSAFSKPSLNIWKFWVHIMLKPSLEELSITLQTWEMSATVQWLEHSLVLPFLGTEMRIDLFQSSGHCWLFQISWHIEWSTLIASSFRILNNSARMLSPPLALWAAGLPNAHLTSHSRMSGSEWETTPLWLSGSLRYFFVQFFCVLFPSLLGLFCCIKSQTPKSQSDLEEEEQSSRLGLLISNYIRRL